jgi:branched-chain amino acid transport system substrate-binding protein
MNTLYSPSMSLIIIVLSLVSGYGEKIEDATKAFDFDPVTDQFKANAINIGSIANMPSTRNAVLLAVKQINEAGGA